MHPLPCPEPWLGIPRLRHKHLVGSARFGAEDEQSMEIWIDKAMKTGEEGKLQSLIRPRSGVDIDEFPLDLVAPRNPCLQRLCSLRSF